MPLVGECCVNLSGRNVTVTDGNNHAIGELMNREFFTGYLFLRTFRTAP